MSEAQHNASDLLSAQPSDRGGVQPPPDELPELAALLSNGEIENTDNTPTIISKSAPDRDAAIQDPLRNLQGRSLAHFELIAPIGVGGMAAVLLARDRQLDRVVALKILPPDMARDTENVRRFHQEARAAAKLDHENIARVFYCGEDQGLHFIAFEFVEGENLRTLLERRGPLPVAEAVHYLLQVATGLAHAASRGVVHRDIKPSNIIITPAGRAKLVDMGLARSLDYSDSRALTQSGVTLGTFEYISPEQALEPRQADVRSDIYSLGCTFYHVLTGSPPVPEGTAAKKLHHHQHVAPIDPRQLNPEIPDSVAAILGRMMAKNPRDRYQSAEHLVQHLLQAAKELGCDDRSAEGMVFVDAPLPAPPQKRPGLLLALGLGALVVVVVALTLAQDSPRQQAQWPFAEPKYPRTGDKPRGDKDRKEAPSPVPEVAEVTSEQQLREALKKNRPHVDVVLKRDLVLSSGLVFDGQAGGMARKFTLRSADPARPAKLSLKLDAPVASGTTASLLRVRGARARIENVHFFLAVATTPDSADVAAVAVEDGSLEAYDCRFEQEAPVGGLVLQPAKIPVASVAFRVSRPGRTGNGIGGRLSPKTLGADAAERPREKRLPASHGESDNLFKGCWFARGQTAVRVTGPAFVRHEQCAFGPHHSLFHLPSDDANGVRESMNGPTPALSLSHCSAVVVYGPAFRIDTASEWTVDVQYSVFSGQAGKVAGDDRHLIDLRHVGGWAGRYRGQRNVYHNLHSFVLLGDEPKTWADFRSKLADESHSHDLLQNPWDPVNESPLKKLDPLAAGGAGLQAAFRVNPLLPELRQLDDRQQPGTLPIGVTHFAGGDVYDGKELAALRPPEQVVTPAKGVGKKIIVDPSGATEGAAKNLTAAVASVGPGDEILLKTSDALPVRSIEISPKVEGVTIKAHPGYQPTLTLYGDGSDPEAALFKLTGGRVRFEKIRFRLQPDRKGFLSQSVMALTGGSCVFEDCIFTLKAPTSAEFQTMMQVFSVPAAAGTMAQMDMAPPAPPAMELRNCLVRGQGALLSLEQSIPFDLKVTGSLIVLEGDGSFDAQGSLVYARGELAKLPAGARAPVQLSKTVTHLSGSLLHLIQKKGKTLTPTHLDASDSLFLAASERALIRVEGLESQQQLPRVLTWRVGRNAYCGYAKILDGQPFTEAAMAPLSMDPKEWRMMSDEGTDGPGEAKNRFLESRVELREQPAIVWPESVRAALQTLQESERVTKEQVAILTNYLPHLRNLEARLSRPGAAKQPADESEERSPLPADNNQ